MESTNTNLIEWSEIANKEIKGDKLNPIDKFLYENEPAEKEQSDLFRKQFLEAINYKSSAGKNDIETSEPHLTLGGVMRSCVHCGNKKEFKVWTELEYDDGSDEPTTGNHLINVEFVKCLKCGEVL